MWIHSESMTGNDGAKQIPQVLPAASLMYPLSPHEAPQEFLIFQTPLSSTPTSTTPWFKLALQLVKTPLAKNISVWSYNINSNW